MGRNKALLEVGGVSLIERQIAILRPLFGAVLISGNQVDLYRRYGEVVADVIPDAGALGGIYSGLLNASSPHVFAVACDMPFLRADVIERLVAMREGHDVVIPSSEDGLEPLHALYSKECMPPIRQQLESGNRKIIDFFDRVRVLTVSAAGLTEDGDASWLTNVNTVAEYEDACRNLTQTGSPPMAPGPS